MAAIEGLSLWTNDLQSLSESSFTSLYPRYSQIHRLPVIVLYFKKKKKKTGKGPSVGTKGEKPSKKRRRQAKPSRETAMPQRHISENTRRRHQNIRFKANEIFCAHLQCVLPRCFCEAARTSTFAPILKLMVQTASIFSFYFLPSEFIAQ